MILIQAFGSQAETTAAFVISDLMQAEQPPEHQSQSKQHHRLGLAVSPSVDLKLNALKVFALCVCTEATHILWCSAWADALITLSGAI